MDELINVIFYFFIFFIGSLLIIFIISIFMSYKLTKNYSAPDYCENRTFKKQPHKYEYHYYKNGKSYKECIYCFKRKES